MTDVKLLTRFSETSDFTPVIFFVCFVDMKITDYFLSRLRRHWDYYEVPADLGRNAKYRLYDFKLDRSLLRSADGARRACLRGSNKAIGL